MFNGLLKKSAKLVAALALGLAVSLVAVPSTFALNRDGSTGVSGHKPLSFTGYQYVDSTHVVVNIDKQIDAPKPTFIAGEVDKSMFTIKNRTTQLFTTISSLSYLNDNTSGYSGNTGADDTCRGLAKGTRILLTLATPLTANTAYDLTMQSTLFANQSLNNFNNTGDPNYYDQTFTFRTPASGAGTATSPYVWSNTTPYVTFVVGGSPVSNTNDNRTNVSYESSLSVVFDRPILASTRDTFLANLSDNYKRGGVKVVQGVGNVSTAGAPAGTETHYPTSNNVNNANTVFYFPETNWGSGTSYNTYSFNRKNPGSYSYTLTLPSFTDASGHTFTSFLSSRTNLATTGFSFSTVTADLPGHGNQITVARTTTAGQLLVSWSAIEDPAPTGVKVYATTGDKWTSYYTLKGQTTSNSVTSYTITGLTSGTLYWVRIAPYNSIGTIGFSQESSGTPL
ncbi:hypothetical protein SOV_28050 [Sporomusa ovata DSM 2662]|uniref:RTX toxins and related Ca2+-binding proteins n=1 Tax=Sporomusa ovata TaxID=2378 RepID=A0A0U1L4U4_9FIRM|nr:fibronectin type III domain-containing protein [Sporomusa ovata]EQB26115.1 fibronectin type III domain containing protein [Sporomusa ovata DSM 2662]CQR74690.1 RTX toxins and related Ca2+-binding proteins [Sporomusa ovata]